MIKFKLNKTQKNRIIFIDILKGIAIFLMIYGHCIQYGSWEAQNQNSFFNLLSFQFIYSFHMPLFMLISGFLFKLKENFRKDIEERIKSLVVPILVWGLIDSMRYLTLEIQLSFYKYLILNIIYNLWFLWAILYSSIIVIVVERSIKNKYLKKLIYFLGVLFSFVVPDYFNGNLYKYMYPYFVIGYYNKDFLTKLENLKNNLTDYYIVTLILGVIFVILLKFYDINSYIYVSKYFIFTSNLNLKKQIIINIYRFLIGLIGSLWIIYLLKYLISITKLENLKNILILLGRNSLGLYIITNYFFLYSRYFRVLELNYLILLIETIILIFVVLVLVFFIKKVKILDILLLGGRN